MGKFKKTETSIEGVYIVEPTVFGDNRGYFMETYNKADFEEIGLNYNFIQDNQSKSKKGVLRGLHFQKKNSQAKLVRCRRGFAPGFLVWSDEAECAYKLDNIYTPVAEGGLAWNDSDVAIDWPFGDINPKDLLTSEKDAKWPSLKELKETDLYKNL